MCSTIDRLFESRSSSGNISFIYKNIFEALFINGGFKYNRSWKNLLYGYNYQGIMSVKTTIDQPTESSGYDVNVNVSKGLDLWPATIRIFGGYNENTGKLLIQDEILNYQSEGYSARGSLNINPTSLLSVNYSFAWNQSKSYIIENTEGFPAIRGISQTANMNVFPHKTLTVNINFEHQYNNATSSRHTTFADAGVKFRHKQWDLELALNNIFNTKQYVSASYSDISTYYYSYQLRPMCFLLKTRFKLK
ncbi:MAG: hypothetical protein LBG28_06025 [Tannerella sp.]|jgi:outer membrane receptor protein involved in Fe transport|nr:hypothetical protein [Tannerella sp.]